MWNVRTFTLLTFCFLAASAQQYTLSTFAGSGGPPASNNPTGVSFGNPTAIAADSAGNIYFSLGGAVMKLNASGALSPAALTTAAGMAVDASGNLYVTDPNKNVVNKIAIDGTTVAIAGSGSASRRHEGTGDGGPATEAPLFHPQYVAVDNGGNVYIAEQNVARVRKVSPNGIITTVAGTGQAGYSGDGGPAASAQIGTAWGLAADNAGDLYLSDVMPTRSSSPSATRIRKVSTNGIITTVAGTGMPGYSGDGGSALNAQLSSPGALAVDSGGNLYIADLFRIRKVSVDGTIATIAGNGSQGFTGDGGPAASAQISGSTGGSGGGLAVASSGDLYIADTLNSRIRTISADGTIQTVAGDGNRCCYSGDGSAAASISLDMPLGVAVDAAGNVYIANTGDGSIFRASPAGILTAIAGIGSSPGITGDGGPALHAFLNLPVGMTFDSSGNLYVAEAGGHRVRKIDAAGTITTVAGTGAQGSNWTFEGSRATAAELIWPEDVAVDAAGNLYIADPPASAIRKVTPDGIITTVAGINTGGFSGDGGPAIRAQLKEPSGVAVDRFGDLYVADTFNFRIRKITPDGTITTVAGSGYGGYLGDGIAATSAGLQYPVGIRVDAAGNLYLGDETTVRLISPDGIIHTLAGPAASGTFFEAWGVAFNGTGDIYAAGLGGSSVHLLQPVTK
jgi:sugar lactone lactonase YvrE